VKFGNFLVSWEEKKEGKRRKKEERKERKRKKKKGKEKKEGEGKVEKGGAKEREKVFKTEKKRIFVPATGCPLTPPPCRAATAMALANKRGHCRI